MHKFFTFVYGIYFLSGQWGTSNFDRFFLPSLFSRGGSPCYRIRQKPDWPLAGGGYCLTPCTLVHYYHWPEGSVHSFLLLSFWICYFGFVFLGVCVLVVVLVLFYVFAFSWSEVLVRLRGFANIYTRKAALAAVQPSWDCFQDMHCPLIFISGQWHANRKTKSTAILRFS